MRTKLVSSAVIAGLLVFAAPTAASAAQQTIVDTPSELIAVDPEAPGGGVLARTFDVSVHGDITKVTLEFDFMSSGSSLCDDNFDWNSSFPDELGLTLASPAGTEVPLILPYPNNTFGVVFTPSLPRVQIVFDDAASQMVGATNDGSPESGTFQPVTPLSVFNGETAAGQWELRVTDAYGGAAQCYYGAKLTVGTDFVVASTVTLTASNPAVEVGTETVLTAEVDPAATGDVDFLHDGVSLGVAPVIDGVATLPISFDSAGEYDITAEYSGDDHFEVSVSEPVTVSVADEVIPDPDGPGTPEPEVTTPTPPSRVETGR